MEKAYRVQTLLRAQMLPEVRAGAYIKPRNEAYGLTGAGLMTRAQGTFLSQDSGAMIRKSASKEKMACKNVGDYSP